MVNNKRMGYLQVLFGWEQTRHPDEDPSQRRTRIMPVGSSERDTEYRICYVEATREKHQVSLWFFDREVQGHVRGLPRTKVHVSRKGIVRKTEEGGTVFELKENNTGDSEASCDYLRFRASSKEERNKWVDFIEGRDEFKHIAGVFAMSAALVGVVCLALGERSFMRLASALQEPNL